MNEFVRLNSHVKFSSNKVKVIPQYCIAHPYCARFCVTSTRKLARARTDNERNFPQALVDSEINVRFLLNEHGDLYILLHNNSVHIILLHLQKKTKKFHRKEKKI